MIAYNHVVIIGTLTRDPDVRTVGSAGMKVARLSVCINERRKSSTGKIVENHIFVEVDAWARLAELCEQYLSKSSNIFVEGRLQMEQWEKDGVRRQKLKIRAHNIKFLPKPGKFNASGKHSKESVKVNVEPTSQEAFVPDESDIQPENDFESAINDW